MSEVTELKFQAVAFGSSVPFTGSEVPAVKTCFFLFPAFAVVLLIFPPPPGFFKLSCVFVLTIDLCNLYQFWPQTSFTPCLGKKNQDSDIYVIFTFYVVVDISKQHLKYELCFLYSTKRDKKILNLTLYKEDKADKVVSIQQAVRI